MIVCHLNKPESTLDAVRKAHAKLKPTDAALIASSLVLCGRYAIAVYDEQEYHWPDDSRKLTDALRMQAEAGPFHGVLSEVRRYDTGNPFGWLTAVVELALDDDRIGTQFRDWLAARM